MPITILHHGPELDKDGLYIQRADRYRLRSPHQLLREKPARIAVQALSAWQILRQRQGCLSRQVRGAQEVNSVPFFSLLGFI